MQPLFKKIIVPGLVVWGVLFSAISTAQEPIRMAVASNFLAPLKALSKDFTAKTGIRVSVSNGASGLLYAQITQGAPYDLFFSADSARPERLEKAGLIEAGSRFTYVTGKLVVWSPNAHNIPADLSKLTLNNPHLHFLAMANPKTAPYGLAAMKVLQHYGLYSRLQAAHKIALGENIGKTYQYVATGNAQLGLVAKSYVSNPNRPVSGQVFDIPESLYPAIRQQAVVLKGRNTQAVERFLTFFHSKTARHLIQQYGYGVALTDQAMAK